MTYDFEKDIIKYLWVQPLDITSLQDNVMTYITIGVIYKNGKNGYIELHATWNEDFKKIYNDMKSRIELD